MSEGGKGPDQVLASREEIDAAELDVRFTYHPPRPDQVQKYEALRKAGRDFAVVVCSLCLNSRERSLALTKIDEAVMHANAAIARRE